MGFTREEIKFLPGWSHKKTEAVWKEVYRKFQQSRVRLRFIRALTTGPEEWEPDFDARVDKARKWLTSN
jgi:hypothetical protein